MRDEVLKETRSQAAARLSTHASKIAAIHRAGRQAAADEDPLMAELELCADGPIGDDQVGVVESLRANRPARA